jgi:hypothetical protein
MNIQSENQEQTKETLETYSSIELSNGHNTINALSEFELLVRKLSENTLHEQVINDD